MERTEFIQRMSTLQTESDEFISTYVRRVYLHPIDETSEGTINLKYTGNDSVVIKKLFVSYCDNFFPEFIIDDSNKKAINYLLEIAAGKSAKPGIIIRGNVGSGKTILALLFINFMQRIFFTRLSCRYYNPVTLMSEYMSKGFEVFSNSLGDILFIDDMGISTESSHYGNKINVIEHLIYLRYDNFKIDPSLKIICTTNLVHKDMVDLYGERAISRLTEMTEWNDGILIGNDKRKENPMRVWPKIRTTF